MNESQTAILAFVGSTSGLLISNLLGPVSLRRWHNKIELKIPVIEGDYQQSDLR